MSGHWSRDCSSPDEPGWRSWPTKKCYWEKDHARAEEPSEGTEETTDNDVRTKLNWLYDEHAAMKRELEHMKEQMDQQKREIENLKDKMVPEQPKRPVCGFLFASS